MSQELKFEMNNFKTDLFYKTEDILKGAETAHKTIESLWVPAFNCCFDWEIPWIKGMSVRLEGEDPIGFIGGCLESL